MIQRTIDAARLNIKIKLGETISLNIRQLIIEFYLDNVETGEYLFTTITPTPRWNEPKYPERLATLLFCTGKGTSQDTEYFWQSPNECNILNYTLPLSRVALQLPVTTTTSTTSTVAGTTTTTTTTDVDTGTTTSTTQTSTATGTTTTSTTTNPNTGTTSSTTSTTSTPVESTGTSTPSTSPTGTSTETASSGTSTTTTATTSTATETTTPSTTESFPAVPQPTTSAQQTTIIVTPVVAPPAPPVTTTSTTPTPTPTPTPSIPEDAPTAPPSASISNSDEIANSIPGFTEAKASLPAGSSRVDALKKMARTAILPLVRSAIARKKAKLNDRLKKELQAFIEKKKLEAEQLKQSKQSVIEGGTALVYPLSTPQTTPTSSVEIPRTDPATLPTASSAPSASEAPQPANLVKTKSFYFVYEAGAGFKERGGFNAVTVNLEDRPTIPSSGIYVFAEGGVYDYYFNGNLVDTSTGPNTLSGDDTTIIEFGLTVRGLRKANAERLIANFICTSPERFGGLQPGCDTGTYKLPEASFKVNPTPAETDDATLYRVLTKVMRETRLSGFDQAIIQFTPGVPPSILNANNANFRSLGLVVDEAKFQLPQYIETFINKMKAEKINCVSSDKSQAPNTITQFVLTPLETLTTPTASPTGTTSSTPPTSATNATSTSTTNPRIREIDQRVAEIDRRLTQIRTEVQQISRIAQTDDTALDRFQDTITRLENEDKTLRDERTKLLQEKQSITQG